MADNKLSILLIEDDENHCAEYKNCISAFDDIELIGVTNSSVEGIKLTEANLPEAVILDLELNKGDGTGLKYLSSLKNLNLTIRPFILVVTVINDEVIYNHIREEGVSIITHKGKPDYSAELIVDTIRDLLPSIRLYNKGGDRNTKLTINSSENQKADIRTRISREMDLLGMNPKLSGRMYIIECVYLLLLEKDKTYARKVYRTVADKFEKSEQAITKAISTSIKEVWRKKNYDDLAKLYTAYINPDDGVPSSTEFIYHYVEKIGGKNN